MKRILLFVGLLLGFTGILSGCTNDTDVGPYNIYLEQLKQEQFGNIS